MSPATYSIPRSRLFGAARDVFKPFLKRTGPLYTYLTSKYYWARVFVNYLFIKAGVKTGIWSQAIYVEVTNVCNAKCVFCAYPGMERPKTVMTLEHFRSVVDQWAKLGGDEVDLTPIVGDPFVDRFLFDRMDYLLTIPSVRRFHFFTNAILMTAERQQRLCGYGSKLTVFNSFGGFDRQTYHQVMGVDKFEEAVANIRGLIEAKRRAGSAVGVQLNLRTPPGSERGEFWDYLQKAKSEGLLVIDRVAHFDSWAGLISDEAMRAAGLPVKPMPVKRGPCNRLLTSPVVLADGRVGACGSRDIEATLVIGDLKQQPLGEIFSGDKLRGLIDRHDSGDLPEVCRRCNFYDSIYPTWLQGRLFPLVKRLVG